MASKPGSTLSSRVTTLDLRRGATVTTQRIRGWELSKIRKRIMKRDGYACKMCGRATIDGEVDHVVPLHVGGSNSEANYQWLCKDCHKLKSENEGSERW